MLRQPAQAIEIGVRPVGQNLRATSRTLEGVGGGLHVDGRLEAVTQPFLGEGGTQASAIYRRQAFGRVVMVSSGHAANGLRQVVADRVVAVSNSSQPP